MLLTLKEDSTSGSFYLCNLLHVLSMIIQSGAICTSVCLCTIIICTYGTMVYMCSCILLFIACVLYYMIYVCQHWYVCICGDWKIMDNFYVIVHV